MLEYDSENLNSEEIYSSLRGVTEAIQNFSFRSQEDLMEPLRRDGKRDGMVRTKMDRGGLQLMFVLMIASFAFGGVVC